VHLKPEDLPFIFNAMNKDKGTCYTYRIDTLNNLVFLCLSLCTKRSILFGRGNLTDTV